MQSWKLATWPRTKHEKRTAGSAWEIWTVATAGSECCAPVRREINSLWTFETTPFSCLRPVENVEKIREHIHDDCRWTIYELADTNGVCQEILTGNLNMHHTAPSSQQCARPYVPENYRVCDKQQHAYSSPSSVLKGLSPVISLCSQIENETERTMFWNSVWCPKETESGIRKR
jgi:hypothetical protein